MDANTTHRHQPQMDKVASLFDALVRKAQKRYRKLLKAEVKGDREKARKHERKLIDLNLKIGFFKRQRKSPSNDENHREIT